MDARTLYSEEKTTSNEVSLIVKEKEVVTVRSGQ